MTEQGEATDISLLKSKEIDEIIGRPPHWLIQWGISVFFIILILVLGLSYFIKYPEIITTPFNLITDGPSVPVSVNESGSLIKLFVKEGSVVHANDTLFYWVGRNGEKQNIFRSTSNGRINFISPLFNGCKIEKGQFLFYIIPVNPVYYATLYVSSSNIRRIKISQHVRLELQDYPGSEYGYLDGVIDYLSIVKTTKGYNIRAMLPKGLRSDKNRILLYKEGFSGTAEIMINKRRLIFKFIYKKEAAI